MLRIHPGSAFVLVPTTRIPGLFCRARTVAEVVNRRGQDGMGLGRWLGEGGEGGGLGFNPAADLDSHEVACGMATGIYAFLGGLLEGGFFGGRLRRRVFCLGG